MDYNNPIPWEIVQDFFSFKFKRKVESCDYFCGMQIKEKTAWKFS